jgi:hypothetical protein
MELVEGPTLADRIKQGAIPLKEALPITRQIADALEAAHEKGIVHRDLKPANIKIKPDGVVKVLDFGLAKIAELATSAQNPEISPTLTLEATRMGQILGTAAYMAPEQARGKTVDKRADIWAFGVVLYETLTGRRLFQGETISDTLASVLAKEPDFERVPARAQRLLKSCLEKDPKLRLRDIADAWRLLEGAEVPAAKSRKPWIIAAGLLAAALAVALWAPWRATRAPTTVQPLVRLDLDLGPDVSLGSRATLGVDLGATAPRAGSPTPVEPETRAVPADDGFELDQDENIGPAGPTAVEYVQNRRSREFNGGRGRFRLSTATCCRRARTSRAVSHRLRKKTRRADRMERMKSSTNSCITWRKLGPNRPTAP